MSTVFREFMFIGAWDVGHKAFAGVVQKAGQNQTVRQTPGLSFFSTADTVLAYGPEGFHMAVGSAD